MSNLRQRQTSIVGQAGEKGGVRTEDDATHKEEEATVEITKTVEIQRTLGLFSGISLIVGIVIGNMQPLT